MACMTHECNLCGHKWFNNEDDEVCPDCGSETIESVYDEQFEEPDCNPWLDAD